MHDNLVAWLAVDVREAITHAARTAWPQECCGLLGGQRLGDGWAITQAIPMTNAMVAKGEGERRFEISPQSLFDVQRAFRGQAVEVIGHYHSHPNGSPIPSPCDRAAIADPLALWLIAGIERKGGDISLGAWLPDATADELGFIAIPCSVACFRGAASKPR